MRLIRKLRLLVLLAPVAAMLGTALPAEATTRVGSIVFVGTATTGPLSYPCVDPPTPPITTSKCPLIPGAKNGTVTVHNPTTGGQTNVSVPIGGNNVGFAFNSTACVGTTVGTKPPSVAAGTCVILAAGTLTGHCGLSTGRGTATVNWLTTTKVPGGTPPNITAQFAFVSVGGTLVITGTSGPNTAVVGVVEAIPIPTVPPVPPNNSCSNKTATTFTIAGSAEFIDI